MRDGSRITIGAFVKINDLFLVPNVVAGSENVGAEFEQFFGDGGSDTEAAGGVLGVHDQQFDLVCFHHMVDVLSHDIAAGTAENVTNEKNIHAGFDATTQLLPRREFHRGEEVVIARGRDVQVAHPLGMHQNIVQIPKMNIGEVAREKLL